MRYDDYSYLWPPRPDQAVLPTMLPALERQGYAAQIKKNGTCSVIAVTPDKGIIAKNRHKEDHKLWSPDLNKMSAFRALPGKGWYVFVAELIHSKVPGLRDINYIHDVLVFDGEYLVGMTQAERHAKLVALFNAEKFPQTYSHWVIDEYTWVARQFTKGDDFKAIYDNLDKPEDEGIVLKLPTKRLGICAKEKSNNAGMLKSRKAHKNYSF